jgi:hypothetical protein
VDWENERYVRLYVRDTVTWKLLPWEAQAVFPNLLRKLDRAGVLNLGGVTPAEAVAAALDGKWPLDVVAAGVTALFRHGVVEWSDNSIVAPNFLEAQECTSSTAQRKRESRAKRRDLSRPRPDTGQVVTKRPESATPSLAVPCLADLKEQRGVSDATDLPPTREQLAAWSRSPYPEPGYTPANGALTQPVEPATSQAPSRKTSPRSRSHRRDPTSGRQASGTTAASRRIDRARELWERYEAHRVQTLTVRPRRPDARKLEQAAASIVRLVEHVRGVEGVDEESAWGRVEAYGRGAIDEAAQGDRDPDWARKLVAFRGDWHEWRSTRFDKWAAGEGAGQRTPRPRPSKHDRGPVDPATQDHDEPPIF